MIRGNVKLKNELIEKSELSDFTNNLSEKIILEGIEKDGYVKILRLDQGYYSKITEKGKEFLRKGEYEKKFFNGKKIIGAIVTLIIFLVNIYSTEIKEILNYLFHALADVFLCLYG